MSRTPIAAGRHEVPRGLVVLAALAVFLFALHDWVPDAPGKLPNALLTVGAVALVLYAWSQFSPRGLSALLATWRYPFALAALLHGAAFATIAAFIPVSYTSLLGLWLNDGGSLRAGLLPYRDFVLEYPPLAAVLFWLPTYSGQGIEGYRLGFALTILVFDLLGVAVGLWALRRCAPEASPRGIILLQPLWLVWAGRNLVFEDFDLAPAVLLLLAIALLAAGRHHAAWAALGLGVVLKLYPVLLLPIFLMVAWQQRTRRQLATDIGAFLAAMLLPTLIVMRGHLLDVWAFVSYHLDRGLEVESTYAALLMIGHLITGSPIKDVSGHRAEEIAAPLAPLLSTVALPVTILALAAVYVLAWRMRHDWLSPARLFDSLVRLSTAALITFMITGKVLSPQYLLWLYPLVAVLGRRQGAVWALYGASVIFADWIYPNHWIEMISFTPHAIGVLVARNTILLVLLVLALWPQRSAPPLEGRLGPLQRFM